MDQVQQQAIIQAAVQAAVAAAMERINASAPATEYLMTPNHTLALMRAVGGAWCYPVVGADCPGTVVMPVTGHVLSVARPDLDQMFIGYCQNVCDQATGGQAERYIGTVGSLFNGSISEGLFAQVGGYKADGSNWPEAADRFFNAEAYFTPDQLARQAETAKQWQEVYGRMGAPRKVRRPPATAPAAPTGDAAGTEVPITQG